MASNLRSQCPQPVHQDQNFQNGDPRVHSPISATRGVGHVARFQRRLLSHPYQSKFKEVPQVHFPESNLPIQGSSIWPLYSSVGVCNCSKGGRTHGSGEKHPDAPIPGRLVDPGKRQGHMFSGHPNPPGVVSGVGLGREPQEIRTGARADFQFCRLPVQFGAGSGQTYPRKVGSSQLQDQFPAREDQLFGSRTHVLDRPSHRNRKAGDIGSPPYEANTVAPGEPLAHPGVLGEGHPDAQIPSPHLLWWLKEENFLSGQHLHPLRHAVQIFTDASNEGWGAHLGDYTARGGWSVPESKLHINFLELKAVLLALKAFES